MIYKKNINIVKKIEKLMKSIEGLQAVYEDYRELRTFYDSVEWQSLYKETTENNRLDVLDENQLFDLIGQHNDCLGDLLELSATMYKEI
ncbi:DUF4298 domain-containing protein [Streptococcus parauberis]|uniref:DUF4298 domain-containing protein n=1 Tax=Streptococcus parauberis NCFD 2020 TaxID=873447 RepID=F1Z1L5_9STRE|nr:DUF4298 domain-containing protein [Streptococcus parauberis]EGE53620.1 hypothetical protein SPB_2092 [Streptococcus parauberis NCFD 2020]